MGWIKLDRSLMSNWLWNDKEPFDKRSAWVDLLMMASYSDGKVYKDGKVIENKRGVVNRSLLSLAERWRWDIKKVRRFLKVLESDQMVSVNSTTRGTTITIVNYGVYQSDGITNGATDGQLLYNSCPNSGTQYKNNKEIENKKSYYPLPDNGNIFRPLKDISDEELDRRLRERRKS